MQTEKAMDTLLHILQEGGNRPAKRDCCGMRMKRYFYKLYKHRVAKVDRVIFPSLAAACDSLSNALHLTFDEELRLTLKEAIIITRREASIHAGHVLRDHLLAKTILEPALCSQFVSKSQSYHSFDQEVPDWILMPRVCNLPGCRKIKKIFRGPNVSSRRACAHLFLAWKSSKNEDTALQALKHVCQAVYYIESARKRRLLFEKFPIHLTKIQETPFQANGNLLSAEELSSTHM